MNRLFWSRFEQFKGDMNYAEFIRKYEHHTDDDMEKRILNDVRKNELNGILPTVRGILAVRFMFSDEELMDLLECRVSMENPKCLEAHQDLYHQFCAKNPHLAAIKRRKRKMKSRAWLELAMLGDYEKSICDG
ncbi:TPA: hypothetical protein TY768_000904 [Streptococcus suis]|nr:hypothetical protein [Streptococcus suis]